MTPYDMIKAQMEKSIPFAAHVGVELVEIASGSAVAELEQRKETSNHINSQHAGAMFTLGEAASGAALAGALTPVILQVRPVAAGAEISYVRIAKGRLRASAEIGIAPQDLISEIRTEGKAVFDVRVDIKDASGETVANMVVHWHVRTA